MDWWWVVGFFVLVVIIACIPDADQRRRLEWINRMERDAQTTDPSMCCAMVADCDCSECKALDEKKRRERSRSVTSNHEARKENEQ